MSPHSTGVKRSGFLIRALAFGQPLLVVDGDALAERDVTDDRVARHRAAALGDAETTSSTPST